MRCRRWCFFPGPCYRSCGFGYRYCLRSRRRRRARAHWMMPPTPNCLHLTTQPQQQRRQRCRSRCCWRRRWPLVADGPHTQSSTVLGPTMGPISRCESGTATGHRACKQSTSADNGPPMSVYHDLGGVAEWARTTTRRMISNHVRYLSTVSNRIVIAGSLEPGPLQDMSGVLFRQRTAGRGVTPRLVPT